MAFPVSPTNGQQITLAGVLYQYDSTLTVWKRLARTYSLNANNTTFSNLTITNNVTVSGNITTGNIQSTGFYFANGTPFVSSNYGNTEVSAYLASYYTYANANAATQATAISTVQTQVYSNVNTAAYLAGNVTTGNVFTGGLFYANGAPYSTGGGTSTSAYMLSYIFGA